MKYLVITVIALILVNHASAQSDGAWVRKPVQQHEHFADSDFFKKSLLIINGGLGIPFNGFASKNGSDINPGYALNGGAFNLILRIPLENSGIGFTATLGYAFNVVDARDLATNEILVQNVPYATNITSLAVNQATYTEFSALIGGSYVVSVDRFSTILSLTAGLLIVQLSPIQAEYTIIPVNAPPGTSITNLYGTGPNEALGFAAKAGLGLSYSITKSVFAIISASVLLNKMSSQSTLPNVSVFEPALGIGFKL